MFAYFRFKIVVGSDVTDAVIGNASQYRPTSGELNIIENMTIRHKWCKVIVNSNELCKAWVNYRS